MPFLLLLQSPTPTPVPPHIPEWTSALLTLVYVGAFLLLILLLYVALLRYRLGRARQSSSVPDDLPKAVRKRLGSTTTNRGLKALRWVFVLLAAGVFGFHIYWARYAATSNLKFQELSYKDLRNRRVSESTLRGWIFDRSGRLDRALALYQRESDGDIVRLYPMDKAFAHIFGSDWGDPGLERALFGIQSGVMPEALQVVNGETDARKSNADVRITIDRDLQQAAVDQLKGKHGAVVVLNPQTGEVLALFSEPSFALKDVQDKTKWTELDNNKKEKPLVDRALNEYYVPGSTFKTLMMITAFRNGMQNIRLNTSGGFTPAGCGKTITDDNGSCEACGEIGIDTAYQHSSNIYFSYLGTQLGGEKIRDTARLLGLGAYDSVSGESQGRREPEIWNASTQAIKNSIAPTESWLKAGPHSTRCELMYEGYGQGLASQMTPFQMALMVSAAANLEGKLMKPKIEFDRAPEAFSQVLTREQATEVRRIMNLVTEGGTANSAMAPVKAAGIRSGGKTGTAQKQVPLFDPKTGQPKTRLVLERDFKGKVIRQHEEIIFADQLRSDAWYLSFAPLDKPVLAIAVLVEGPGPGVSFYGGTNAAPIAAQIILKAKALGYFGGPRSEESAADQKGKRKR
jgi:penicillin-binding protein A